MSPNVTLCDRVQRIAQIAMDEMGLPGIVVAVTDCNQKLLGINLGMADKSAAVSVSEATVFEIGSLGKPFTAIALLQLRSEGRLDLDLPVQNYLPWFEPQSQHQPITVHHLLNHTSGLPRGTDIAPHGLYESWALRDKKTSAPPGEYFCYSNIGYKTLGFLLERLEGKPLAEIIRTRVLEPLGMADTFPAITADMRKHCATGYTSIFDDRPEHSSHPLVPAIWSEYTTGDGAQASTSADMTKYLRMLLNRGRVGEAQVIGDQDFDRMTKSGIWTGGDYYGYGLAMYQFDDREYIGHGGGNSGFRSAIVVDMDAGFGVVALTNRMGETDPVVEVAQEILSSARSLSVDSKLPPYRQLGNQTHKVKPQDYVGQYKGDGCNFSLVERDGNLAIEYDEQLINVESRGADRFYIPHPDFKLALLEFGREDGRAVEAFHGPNWFKNEHYKGPIRHEHPEHWPSFVGHYRARNPELSNFRVVIRKGRLTLLNPWGNTDLLVPLDANFFQISSDPLSPETLEFMAISDGKALRCDYSDCPYYRTFTK